jgi:hypothetical protein
MLRDEDAVQARAMSSHGAVFAEVKVDPDLGQVRVTRLVGASPPAGSSTPGWCAASTTAA